MTDKVHVVMGSTGEYSDTMIWYVYAFTEKSGALALADKLNKWCKDHECHPGNEYTGPDSYVRKLKPPPEDPEFQCDYTGVMYEVLSIPLKLAPEGIKKGD